MSTNPPHFRGSVPRVPFERFVYLADRWQSASCWHDFLQTGKAIREGRILAWLHCKQGRNEQADLQDKFTDHLEQALDQERAELSEIYRFLHAEHPHLLPTFGNEHPDEWVAFRRDSAGDPDASGQARAIKLILFAVLSRQPAPAQAMARERRPATPREQCEVKVSEYLKANRERAAKGTVGIREVAKETGVSQTSIQKTTAWQALQRKLEEKGLSKRPRKKKAQAYTEAMDGFIGGEGTLDRLIAEQTADDEGSPLYEDQPSDRGHRAFNRIRKKF